jgi:hypothetical protein
LLVLAAAAVAAAVATARALRDSDDDGGTDTVASEDVRERDGLRLRITVDREEYQVGEEVTARAEITNERADAVPYSGVPGEPGFRVSAISAGLAGEVPLVPEGSVAPPSEGSLASGETLEISTAWDQQLDLGDFVQAPEGRYSIQATFSYTLPGAQDKIDLQAVATFQLKGGEFIVDPRTALENAIRNEEVKAWMQGRAENIACAYPPRGLFFQAFVPTGTAAETFVILYQSLLDQGAPICGIVSEDENWRLIMFHRNGEEPRRMSAFLDIHSGEFIRFEEGGPEPEQQTPAPSASP